MHFLTSLDKRSLYPKEKHAFPQVFTRSVRYVDIDVGIDAGIDVGVDAGLVCAWSGTSSGGTLFGAWSESWFGLRFAFWLEFFCGSV